MILQDLFACIGGGNGASALKVDLFGLISMHVRVVDLCGSVSSYGQ